MDRPKLLKHNDIQEHPKIDLPSPPHTRIDEQHHLPYSRHSPSDRPEPNRHPLVRRSLQAHQFDPARKQDILSISQ